ISTPTAISATATMAGPSSQVLDRFRPSATPAPPSGSSTPVPRVIRSTSWRTGGGVSVRVLARAAGSRREPPPGGGGGASRPPAAGVGGNGIGVGGSGDGPRFGRPSEGSTSVAPVRPAVGGPSGRLGAAVSAVRAAAIISRLLWYRSWGFFARERSSTPLNAGGRSGRSSERLGNLFEHRQRALRFERPLATQQLPEVFALDVAHGDIVGAVDLADVVDRDDVGVMEIGGDARLLLEALDDHLVGGERGLQDL